ncbi:MAG: HAMP domain-containing histidine kinase [Gammaproteobacteria bacterium]|nr:HAMP domain-containing histidine kinase [Gammaproteobacteria bacterium]
MVTKSIKKSALIPLTLLGGCFFLWLLIFEYQQQKNLLEANQILVDDASRRSLGSLLEKKLSVFPDSYAELNMNWSNYEPNFVWVHKGKQIFPPIPGDVESFWQTYSENIKSNPSQHASVLMQERIKIIEDISRSLNNNNDDYKSNNVTETLRTGITRFLAHKENYRLTVTEELISNFMVLDIDTYQRWSPDFVESLLFRGFRSETTKILSAFHLLFENTDAFAASDIRMIANQISAYAEAANLSLDRLQQMVQAVLKPTLQFNSTTCYSSWIISSESVSHKLNQDDCIVSALDMKSLENKWTLSMQQTGQLSENDSIAIVSSSLPNSLNDIDIKITKESWQTQENQQRLFLIVKIALLLILTLLSIFALYSILQRQARKEQYIQLKEDFVNLVSHELKTPLASIRLMAETLQKRLDKQLSSKDYPEKIQRESDRLWLMVDNILSFNRLQSEQVNLTLSDVNLHQLINEIAETLSCNVIVENRIDDHYVVKADRALINLVFMNLISNAIKYNIEDKVHLVFELSNSNILVTDNGIGIEESLWNDIFDSFFQANAEHKKGFGLGLPLSRKVMNLHNGSLDVVASKLKLDSTQQLSTGFTSGTQWRLVFG